MFPKESHGYRAKETILHLIWEQDQWLETHVKNKKKIRLELKLNLKDNHLTGKNNIFIYYKTIRLYLPFASSSFKFSNLLLHLIFGFILSAQPTIKEILDSPFASNLVVSRDGNTLAWVDNIGGERNIFVATGEQFSSVYQLTKYVGDQGISLSNLSLLPMTRS